jgi:hypothetical protein
LYSVKEINRSTLCYSLVRVFRFATMASIKFCVNFIHNIGAKCCKAGFKNVDLKISVTYFCLGLDLNIELWARKQIAYN